MQRENTRRVEMIRKPAVAGMFYPAEKDKLERMIYSFLTNAKVDDIDGELKALIVPHAGYIYSGQVAAYAYKLLEKHSDRFKRFILLGPSHYVYVSNVVTDKNDYWETLLGKSKIIENDFEKSESAHKKEHCIEVQIPFLQIIINKFEILPLVASDENPEIIGGMLINLLNDETLLIISSDLSHYHDYKTAVAMDTKTNNAIQILDYEGTKKGEACGKTSILAAVDIAIRMGWKCKLLEYKNSGDVTGEKSGVVGYASFAFYE